MNGAPSTPAVFVPSMCLRSCGNAGTAIRAAARRALLAICLLASAAEVSALDPDGRGATESRPAAAAETGISSMPELGSGAPVEIQVAIGFSGTFRLGEWVPLTVTLENRRASSSGHLEVLVPDGDELGGKAFTNIHRRPIDLPGGSRKRFQFTVFLKSFSRPLEIRVLAGGREHARKVVDLRSGVTNARVVLVLGRDVDLDYLNDAQGRRLRVLYPRVERLPERWAGYGGVTALVVHGLSLEGLSARQYAALVKWLAGGGILAVSGGPDYGLLRTPRLASLLPGPPLGLERLTGTAASGFALGGAPLPASRSFHVNRVPHFEGRVLYSTGRTPLVIERPFGRGRVLYLTFDISRYPFDGWPGMPRLWHALLDLPPRESLSARLTSVEEASALPGLVQSSPLSFPGHPIVFVFIVLYLGCVAAACHLRPERGGSRKGLSRLRWAAPLLFAPGAFFLFGPLLFPPGPVAVLAALVLPHPEGPLADLDLEIGMFSSTDAALRLSYRAPEAAFRATDRAASHRVAADWRHQREAAGGFLEPTTRGRYLLHTLEGRDVIAWDLHASLSEARDGFELEVRNGSGRPLYEAWLVLDGHAHPLGSLPADADTKRVLSQGRDAVPLEERSWRRLLASDPEDRRTRPNAKAGMIERELARLRERGAWSPEEALLLGFSTSPLRLAGASAAWRRHELALVLLPVPVERRARDSGGFRS